MPVQGRMEQWGASNVPYQVGNSTDRRARLDITYWDGIGLATATTYFYGTGADSAGTAQADVQIELPEPASMLIWGLAQPAWQRAAIGVAVHFCSNGAPSRWLWMIARPASRLWITASPVSDSKMSRASPPPT